MKTFNIILAVATVVLIIAFTAVRPKKNTDSLTYNPANEARLSGVVEEVQEFYCPVTQDAGAHLVLRTGPGPILVHVSVARFLRDQNVAFQRGERLEVVGAKIRYKGAEGLIAREIARGDSVLRVRDTAGKPLWQ